MTSFRSRLLISILCLLWAAQASHADEPRRAQVTLAAFRVVLSPTRDGGSTESLQPLQTVSPGDTVEYAASYFNDTAQTLHGVQLSIPVPAGGLVLVAGQKVPQASSASLDGSHFSAMPLTRVEQAPDGRRITRQVPLAEYRALRWDLGDVPAGATRTVSARMHLPAIARNDD